MGTTWPLLLSLGFLLHCVTPESPTSSVTDPPVSIIQTTTVPNPTTKLSAEIPGVTETTVAATAASTKLTLTETLVTATVRPMTTITIQATQTPTAAAAPTPTQTPVTPSINSVTPAVGNTVASLDPMTSAAVPVTTNEPDQLVRSELSGPGTLPQTEGSSKQPEVSAATPSNSNVFKATLVTEQTSTPTATPTGGGKVFPVEIKTTPAVFTTTVAPPPQTTTRKSQTEPNGNLRPGATGTTSDSSTVPTSARVVPTAPARTTNKSPRTTTVTSAAIPTSAIGTEPQLRTFEFSLKSKNEEKWEFVEVCKQLMANMEDGRCVLKWQNDSSSKVQFQHVEITGTVKPSLANQHYDELTKKPTDKTTLIAILAPCGALLIMFIILAVCASHHRKPYNETQQHLTEELHTVENGYHDNPTLEVMEVQPEMQEKKVALNGEFNDSWIVPIDNLLKEDIPDEEDTHL